IELSKSPGSTDAIPEGTEHFYFTEARVRSTPLTGLDTSTGTAVTPTDSVLAALGKLQKQNTDQTAAINTKAPIDSAALTGDTTAQSLSVANRFKLPEWTTATRPADGIGFNTDLQAY